MTQVKRFFIIVIIATCCSLPRAQAAVITGIGGHQGDASGVAMSALLSAINNDNSIGASVNGLSILATINGVTPADFIFAATNSSGTSEYYSQVLGTGTTITNASTYSWIGLEIILGYGDVTTGNFVRSQASDFMDFDAPDRDPAPTSNLFPLLNHGPNILTWAGAEILPGQVINFTYSFDLPDFNSYMPDFAQTQQGYDFTIRFNPIAGRHFLGGQSTAVPEPSTFALIGMGLAGLLVFSKKLF